MRRHERLAVIGAVLLTAAVLTCCSGLWFIGSRTTAMLIDSSREHVALRLEATSQPVETQREVLSLLDAFIADHRRGEIRKANVMRLFDRLSVVDFDSPDVVLHVQEAVDVEREAATRKAGGLTSSETEDPQVE